MSDYAHVKCNQCGIRWEDHPGDAPCANSWPRAAALAEIGSLRHTVATLTATVTRMLAHEERLVGIVAMLRAELEDDGAKPEHSS